MKELFKSIDADKSGTITVEELRKALQQWGHKISDDVSAGVATGVTCSMTSSCSCGHILICREAVAVVGPCLYWGSTGADLPACPAAIPIGKAPMFKSTSTTTAVQYDTFMP